MRKRLAENNRPEKEGFRYLMANWIVFRFSSFMMGGSYIRLPFRGWYVKATNKNMEHRPAVPDIKIDNAPNYQAGEDTQLKCAVDELLSQIDG